MDKALIWGTGKYCEKKHDRIAELYEICAFIDSNCERRVFHEKNVISPKQINEYEWDYIIIMAAKFTEILQNIREMKIPVGKVLLGVNLAPYSGRERAYMANGRNFIELDENYNMIYHDETGKSIVMDDWNDIEQHYQKWEEEVKQQLQALPDVPVERAQGALIGKSIKRFYTDDYMQKNRQYIRGIVGEMEDRRYTRLFGNEAFIKESYIADYHAKFSEEEKFGLDIDLSLDEGNGISDKFDCFICTHTLSYVLNLENAIDNLLKMIKPDGTLLITFAGMIHRASAQELEEYMPLYGILPSAIHKILGRYADKIEYSLETYGNLKCAVATLYGIPSDVFATEELMRKDEDYPLVVGVKIKKKR